MRNKSSFACDLHPYLALETFHKYFVAVNQDLRTAKLCLIAFHLSLWRSLFLQRYVHHSLMVISRAEYMRCFVSVGLV